MILAFQITFLENYFLIFIIYVCFCMDQIKMKSNSYDMLNLEDKIRDDENKKIFKLKQNIKNA